MKDIKTIKLILNIVCAIPIMIGIMFILFGMLFAKIDDMGQETQTAQTTATVIDLAENNEGLIAPVFTYTVNGKEYKETSQIYQSPNPYAIGQEITINYDPNAPYMTSIVGQINISSIVNVALSIVGGTLITIAILIRVVGGIILKKKQQNIL